MPRLPLRIKSGLFAYEVGHGIGLGGAYENYGTQFYHYGELVDWSLYYCRPDYASKLILGPKIRQEEEQGIDYEHSVANFLAADITFSKEPFSLQLYNGYLLDHTGDKRTNNFAAPTHSEWLGTIGASFDFEGEHAFLGLEAARNIGRAESQDPAFESVEHAGYMLYAEGGYEISRFTPHASFLLASGNKIQREMVEAGDTVLVSGKNRAFSVFSPINTNLADSLYSSFDNVPLVAMGNGWGLNYGVARPGTFGDPIVLENLILVGAGVDYQITEKFSLAFDWWYLRAKEPGFGQLGGETRRLSRDLGHELDLSCEFALTDYLTLGVLSGYFMPGSYYQENRDDTAGSLFSPFVRGDGEADAAYQVELYMTIEF
jgi:hypothetical protein